MEGHALYLAGEYTQALHTFEKYAFEAGGQDAEGKGRALACAALCCMSLGLHRRGLKFCTEASMCSGEVTVIAEVVRSMLLKSMGKSDSSAVSAARSALTSSAHPNPLALIIFSGLGSLSSCASLVEVPGSVIPTPATAIEGAKDGPITSASSTVNAEEDSVYAFKLSAGFGHVNEGRIPEAIVLFDALLLQNSSRAHCYIGRGTAYAKMGDLVNAVADFSDAICLQPSQLDAYKRRAQCRAAMNDVERGLSDLSRVLLSAPDDADVFLQRGLMHYQRRDYRSAKSDYQRADALLPSSETVGRLGQAMTSLGDSAGAVSLLRKGSRLYPSSVLIWMALGQALKELGEADEALHCFDRVLAADRSNINATYLKGLVHFTSGQHRIAADYIGRAIELNRNYAEATWMLGICLLDTLRWRDAALLFVRLLQTSAKHVCWYYFCIARELSASRNKLFRSWLMDGVFDPSFRESWSKRLDPTVRSDYASSLADVDKITNDMEPWSPSWDTLLNASERLGGRLQYHCAGYTPNVRQWRFCGVAAIEMAEVLRCCFGALGTLRVANCGSSAPGHSSNDSDHVFGWRDLFDIAVRWRQVSEPNDPVLWVDRLAPEQFSDGFGSHTPMVLGQTVVVRYGPMATRAAGIMLRQIRACEANPEWAAAAARCPEGDYEALYATIGRDFWVTTPCESLARPGARMEGTRLTLQRKPFGGFEFSIRTPGTPSRWMEYDFELEAAFHALCGAVDASAPFEELSMLVLRVVFYWYNFMPLTRGTAAVGFTSLCGLYLALGYEVVGDIPVGVQVDWEAILSPNVREFAAAVQPWLHAQLRPTDATTWPAATTAIRTVADALRFLSGKPS